MKYSEQAATTYCQSYNIQTKTTEYQEDIFGSHVRIDGDFITIDDFYLRIKSGNIPPNKTKKTEAKRVKNEYYRKVWEVTMSQDIKGLFGALKRGPHDYHIDHKIPISHGFKNGIMPEVIGNIDNLQPLFWKDNFAKSCKLIFYRVNIK